MLSTMKITTATIGGHRDSPGGSTATASGAVSAWSAWV